MSVSKDGNLTTEIDESQSPAWGDLSHGKSNSKLATKKVISRTAHIEDRSGGKSINFGFAQNLDSSFENQSLKQKSLALEVVRNLGNEKKLSN